MDFRLIKVFLIFFSFYFLTASGHFYVGDEVTRYQLTKSIVEKGSFSIEMGYGMKSVDGRLYSKYGIGYSILSIPNYLIGKFIARFTKRYDEEKIVLFSVSTFNQFITAVCCCLFFITCLKKLNYSYNTSLLLTFIFGLFSPIWPYSKTFFTEPLIVLCFLLLFFFDGFSFISGIVLSVALLTRIDSLIAFPFLVYRYRKKWQNKKHVLFFFLPLTLTIGLLLYYNFYRFNSLFEFGYGEESFSTPIWNGMYGLIFSSGKGLLWYMPILIFYFIFVKKFYELNREYGVVCIGIPLIYLLFFSRWNLWGGDLSWGPRYLIPTIPFLIFPVGLCFSVIKRYNTIFVFFIVLIFLICLFIQFLGTAVNFHTYTDLFYAVEGRNLNASDPLALIHFLPEYSPIRGHFQMLKFVLFKNYCPTILNSSCSNEVNKKLKEKIKLDFWILNIRK